MGVILARLLAPEVFGLIGMVTVFIAISEIFVNGGVNDALIRRKALDEDYLNTAFVFNLFVSLIFYVILFFAAPLIAAFYQKKSLLYIIRVLAITVVTNGLSVIQRVQVAKKIDFKTIAKVNLIATLVGGVVGVVLAVLNYGVWSLVWRTLTLSFITMCMFFIIVKWKPSFTFNKTVFKEIFGFGSRLMILGVIDTVYKNMYFLIIGKYFSPALLGQYTRAENFNRLPSESLTQVIQRVSFPLLAQIQDNKNKLKSSYKTLVQMVTLVSFTSMILLAAVAKDLAVVLLGEEWAMTGEFLQILCFSGLFYPLDALNTNILKVVHRSDIILKVGVIRKLLAIPIILILIFIGIKPFLYALVVHQLLSYIIISSYSKKFIGYGPWNQLKDVAPVFFTSCITFVAISLLFGQAGLHPVYRMLLMLISGVFFCLITYYVFRFEAFVKIKSFILNIKP